MSSENKAFRSKFGGYNKKDVNNYIAEENKRFVKIREDLQKELEESEKRENSLGEQVALLTKEADEARSLLDERDKLIEGYKEDADKKDARIAELEDMVDALVREKDDGIFKNETIEEKDARISELEALVSELRAEKEADAGLKTAADDSIADKARSFDNISDKIDEILEHARLEAQKIVKAAEKAAIDVEGKRAADVNKIKQSITARSASIIEEIRRAVRGARR